VPHTTTTKRGTNTYYYRSRSVREGNTVRKVRAYLGKNLTIEELRKRETEADAVLDISIDAALTTRDRQTLERIRKEHDPRRIKQTSFYEWFTAAFTYHSDAIEGNSFTLKETSLLLFDSIVPKDKSPREVFEVINHRKAFDAIIAYTKPLGKKIICKLQAVVTENTLKSDLEPQRGRYRNIQVFVRGANFIPAKPAVVPREMQKLLRWYGRETTVHPVIKAAYFHAGFESIHPFVDGNGRVGRLILNWMLHRTGYPMITIRVSERLEYYEALEKAREGNLKPLVRIIITNMEDIHGKSKGSS
jgi:Fic family protein